MIDTQTYCYYTYKYIRLDPETRCLFIKGTDTSKLPPLPIEFGIDVKCDFSDMKHLKTNLTFYISSHALERCCKAKQMELGVLFLNYLDQFEIVIKIK